MDKFELLSNAEGEGAKVIVEDSLNNFDLDRNSIYNPDNKANPLSLSLSKNPSLSKQTGFRRVSRSSSFAESAGGGMSEYETQKLMRQDSLTPAGLDQSSP